MRNTIKITVTIFIFLIVVIFIFALLFFLKTEIVLKPANYDNWISAFLSLSAILVGILIILNFTTVLSTLNIGKKASERTEKIPGILESINDLSNRIEKIENRKMIDQMTKCLHALKSIEEKDRYASVLELSEIGSSICLEALNLALKRSGETPKVREAIQYAIGRIIEREKSF